MTKIVFLLIAINSSWSWAIEHHCIANVRDEKQRIVKKEVSLQELRSIDSFKGRFFEILEGESEEAIKFSNKKLSHRACTVYYHLSKARDYFSSRYDIAVLKRSRRIRVRINMTRGWSDTDYYMHKDLVTSYNNVYAIPASKRRITEGVQPWGPELWFSPAKAIKKKSTLSKTLDYVTTKEMRTALLTGVFEGNVQNFLRQRVGGEELTALESEVYLASFLVSIGSIVFIPELAKTVSKLFNKTVYLDTAMIPEVIYHEYTHIVLSDFLDVGKKTPVTEAYANFFASDISGSHAILHKAHKYSKGLIKISAKDPAKFDYWMDDPSAAQFHIGFKLLYEIKKGLGKIIGEEEAREIIFQTYKKLSFSSTLQKDLLYELVLTVKEIYQNNPGLMQKLILELRLIYQELGF